ncbi:hypothetical protein ACFGVR_23295 [Mucilaginibacter sp. AW1-3]
MRIDPVEKVKDDPFKDLTTTQKITRKIAIAVAFGGVFIWLLKVVFGIPG